MENYLEATISAGKKFYNEFNGKGPFILLNLLKFKKVADYTNPDLLKPKGEISGEAAYNKYMRCTLPLLKKAGSRIIFYGGASSFLVGPENEKWEAVLMLEHQSISDFMAFSQSQDYEKTAGHRAAALDDSRLLPIKEKELSSFR